MKPEQIQFRAIRNDDGELVFGYYANIERDGDVIIDTKGQCISIDPETLGQYIGAEDKNGRKIFSGDVLVLPEDKSYYRVIITGNTFRAFEAYLQNIASGRFYELRHPEMFTVLTDPSETTQSVGKCELDINGQIVTCDVEQQIK
jgi:hypothetical protein